jgi:hypothetical protein
MSEESSDYSQSTETRWETPTKPRSDQIEAGKPPKSQSQSEESSEGRDRQS